MAKLQDTSDNLRFPLQGIDLSTGRNAQRVGTPPIGQKVRSYVAGTLRMRGGSRPGITPYIPGQVSGTNLINHLNEIVWVTRAAIPGSVATALTMKLDYSEVNNPPARNAPTVNVPLQWFENTIPTFTGTTGVVVGTPDTPGGRGFGVATFRLSDDGTTVSVTGTFVSAGFDGPYFYAGAPQVQTVTQSDIGFFNPAFSSISGSWAVVSGGNICQYVFKFSVT